MKLISTFIFFLLFSSLSYGSNLFGGGSLEDDLAALGGGEVTDVPSQQQQYDAPAKGPIRIHKPKKKPKPQNPVFSGTKCGRDVSPTECEVVRLVNVERRKRNLSPLKISRQCTSFAKDWSQKQARRGSISHDGFNNRMKKFRIMQTSPRGTGGENVAAGQRSAQEVMQGWMNSPGHRANILDPRFRKIGVSLVINKRNYYKYFWTQCFH